MDRTLKCGHSSESCRAVLYIGTVCVFSFIQFASLEDLTVLNLALSGMKGLTLGSVYDQAQNNYCPPRFEIQSTQVTRVINCVSVGLG